MLLPAAECISQSLLTHRQIDCHQQWHGALAFLSHALLLFPALYSTSCGCTESCVHLLPFSWQRWSLTDSWAPTVRPASVSCSICVSLYDWRPQSTCEGTQTKHKRQTTCKLHSRTRALHQLYVMCWSLEKENRGAGRQGAFSNKILSWMSIHFKERNKKRHRAV